VCRRQDRYELIDGFKRLGAVRGLAQIPRLSARLMEADERQAKAAIYGLNRAGGRTRELEEAWIIQALVREDGLSQVEVAELLGRHKSWVCRRLALVERLGPKAKDELRVGLLTPTAARQIVRLPQGNQTEMLEAIRREALSSAELGGVVDLWLRCSAPHARGLPGRGTDRVDEGLHPSTACPRRSASLLFRSAVEVVVEVGEVVGGDSRPLSGRHCLPDGCQFSLQRAGGELRSVGRVRAVLPSRHLCGTPSLFGRGSHVFSSTQYTP
jgi:hypothetical protein